MLKAELIGNLGHDAQQRTINDRNALCFSVGHSDTKDAPTVWVNVIYNTRENPAILQHLKKGAKVRVYGNLAAKVWNKRDNTSEVDMTIFANEVNVLTFVSDKAEGAQAPAQGGGYQQQSQQAPQYQAPASQPAPSFEAEDDKFPF